MNKRGAIESDKMGALIIAALVVVAIGLGIFLFWDKISVAPKSIPPALTAAVFVCNQALDFGEEAGKAQYCGVFTEYKPTAGADTEYINCVDSRVSIYLDAEKKTTMGTCPTPTGATSPENKFCSDLKAQKGSSYDDKVLVNGKTCLFYGVPKGTAAAESGSPSPPETEVA